ncbi:MAG: hypothetical protein ACI4IS_05985 [Acutalibacteraceae bacterium]
MNGKHSISEIGFVSCYGVALKEFDKQSVHTSVLSNVRRAFFQTGKQQKNNFTKKTDNAIYKFNYHLSKNTIKWVAYKNKAVYQNVVNQPENKYYIQTFDDYGRIVKHDFFDENHIWLKTTYYSTGDKEGVLCSVVPYEISGQPVILRYNTGADKPVVLYLCEAPQTQEQSELLNKSDCLIEAEVLSDSSVLLFANEENKLLYLSKLNSVKESINQKNAPKVYITEQDKKDGITLRKEDFNLSKNLNDTFHIEQSEPFSQMQTPLDFLSVDEKNQDEEISQMQPTENTENNDIALEDNSTEKEIEIQSIIEQAEFFDNSADEIKAEASLAENEEITDDKEQEQTAEALAIKAVEQIDAVMNFDDEKTTPVIDDKEPDAVISNQQDTYRYYGETDENGKREGYGRTVMQNGLTAYDGQYENDMRNGFGCFYYKNGGFCYAGQWLDNKKNGMGVCRRDSDGVIQLGKWKDDKSVGVAARADDKGNITYVGKYKNGKRDGIGVTFDENSNPVVALWKDGTVVQLLYKSEENGEIDE